MGIDGLLRTLKSVTVSKNLKQYEGKRIAVDAYGWLHKIIKSSCLNEIAQGSLSQRYVNDCISRIITIQKLNIVVVMVFDGGLLPGKQKQEEVRKARRQQSKLKALQHYKYGQHDIFLKRLAESIDITPQIAQRLILKLKEKNIQFIVAPYEADAQLAYLSRTNYVDVIITQDSDLLAFGAKRIFYKFDYKSFNGQEICLEKLKENNQPNLRLFTHNMFLTSCILAGCDYLNSISSIGIMTAFRMASSNKTGKKCIDQMRMKNKTIPEDYELNFVKAFLTFRFQRVYCPTTKKCVMLNNVEIQTYIQQSLEQLESRWQNSKESTNWCEQILDLYILEYISSKPMNWEFLGRSYDDQTINKIATGIINPFTLQVYRLEQKQQSKFNGLKFQQSKKQKCKQNILARKYDPNQRTLFDFAKTQKQPQSQTYNNIFEFKSLFPSKQKKTTEVLYFQKPTVKQTFPIEKLSKKTLQISEDVEPIKRMWSKLLEPMFSNQEIRKPFG